MRPDHFARTEAHYRVQRWRQEADAYRLARTVGGTRAVSTRLDEVRRRLTQWPSGARVPRDLPPGIQPSSRRRATTETVG